MSCNSFLRISFSLPLAALLLVGCMQSKRPEAVKHKVVRVETQQLEHVTQRAFYWVNKLGTEAVWVVFDLDNTLLAMQTELGADQWYDWQSKISKANRCDPAIAGDRLAIQGALYHQGAMRPTQENALALVQSLQDEGITTFIMTARGESFRLQTHRELRRNNFDFEHSAPGPEGGFLAAWKPTADARAIRYEDGVYMLAGQDKGEMLLHLIEHLNVQMPKVVLFADDKLKNTEAVAVALEKHPVHAEVFTYHKELERVQAFDESQAVADWDTIRASLQTLESYFGPVNFDLPEQLGPPADCELP